MPLSTARLLCLAVSAAGVLTISCAEPECPYGYTKLGKICRRADAGEAVSAGDGGTETSDVTDGAPNGSSDGGSNAATPPEASQVDASKDVNPRSTGTGDAASDDAAEAFPDASLADGSDEMRGAECDALHACAAGYACSATKCVSACTQVQCDPNATCSLVANAPVCSCNGGFASVRAADGKVTCIRDVKCEELGCDPLNGECLGDSAQTRRCACKNGYTGDGKTCIPVTCPTPSLANGIVSTPEGVTFGKPATYQCNAGYDFPNKVPAVTRMCGADKAWGQAVPACVPKNCGPLTIPYGTADTSRGTTYGSPAASVICQKDFVRSGPATVECQSDGNWSTRPVCLGCGDKLVSNIPGLIQEQCDPAAPSWNEWSCTAMCTKTTAYLFCVTSSGAIQCSNDEMCILGYCAPSCGPDKPCPAVPKSTRGTAICSASSGGVCGVSLCQTSADCAPGLGCYRGSTRPYCTACAGNADCF